MSNSSTQPPFGTHALSPFRNKLRAASGVWRHKIRFVSSVLRQAATLGLSEPFDIEPADGFKVRLFPSNNATDKKCFMGLEVKSTQQIDAMDNAAKHAPSETFNFLDIGGNSGMYSIAAARSARLAGKYFSLVAIEANPDMAERLRFNLQASDVKNAQIVECAVSDQEGTVHLSLAKKNLGQAMVVDSAETDVTVDVPARLLENILDEAGMTSIDFLKIDIEGHEVPALRPYLESVASDRYPKTILAEIAHDPDNQITDLLTSHGYSVSQHLGDDIIFSYQGA